MSGGVVPTFRQIEAFQAVMTAGSVTKAADALGMGQPAVSRLIVDLERNIGFALFQRTGRTLTPTFKGRELAQEVERSFLGMEHIKSTARRLAVSEEGSVRVAVVPSLISEAMSAIIGPFARANPNLAITVEVVSNLEAAEVLESVSCDLGITNEPIQGQGLLGQVLARKSAVCVVRRGHRLARLGRALRPRDLAGERFVSFMPSSRFRRQLDKIFKDAGVERVLRYEVRTTSAACELARAIDAVTIVPVAPKFGSSAPQCVIPFRPDLASDIVLLTHRHRELTPSAARFAMFAQGCMGLTDAFDQRGGRMVAMHAKTGAATRTPSLYRQSLQGAFDDAS